MNRGAQAGGLSGREESWTLELSELPLLRHSLNIRAVLHGKPVKSRNYLLNQGMSTEAPPPCEFSGCLLPQGLRDGLVSVVTIVAMLSIFGCVYVLTIIQAFQRQGLPDRSHV